MIETIARYMTGQALSSVLFMDTCDHSHSSPMRYELISHCFTDETQRGLVTCPRSHSKLVAKLELALGQ